MPKTMSSNSGFFSWLHDNSAKHLSLGKQHALKLKSGIWARSVEHFKRREMRQLLKQSPEHLLDMGISRNLVKTALNLPLSENAANWLNSHKQGSKRL